MLTLILPARNWAGDRIDACLRSFLRLKSKALTEVIVVDFGSDVPIVLPKLRDKRVRLLRIEAPRWSSGEATNTAISVASNPVIAKADCDMIVSRESGPAIDALVNDIAAGKLGIGVVQATDLPPGIDPAQALAASSAELAAEGRLRARWGQGGLCFYSAAVWNEIGGVEARFHGWGNEDNDFVERIRRAGHPFRWIPSTDVRIFHVWHPPQYASKDIIKARNANQQIYATDKSVLRPMRFPHAKPSSRPAPAIHNRPRPLVTVAFASKGRDGRERMLGEAIRAFAGQIDNDFEIVIADNGSTPEQTDDLHRMLKRMPKGPDIRVIDAPPLIPGARNRITAEARGRYICVADDDDLPMPERLADHLACFEKDPTIHTSHGGWIDFDEITGVIDRNTAGDRKLETLLFGRGKVTAHPASFYRRDVMLAVPYDEMFKVGSDLDMALRMANLGLKSAHTGSFVTLRRFHHSNVTLTDLAGQMTVGVDARQRVTESLGSVYEQKLREAGQAAAPTMPCRNKLTSEQVMELIPAYVGVWRLLLPLAELGRQGAAALQAMAPAERMSDVSGTAPDVVPDLPPATLMAVAEELAGMLKGDVEVVDGGINPGLFFVSDRIKGARKALKLKQAVEERFEVNVTVTPDVDYDRRRMTRFDWAKLAKESKTERLISEPMEEIGDALAALSRLPSNTALRAMTSIVADFNCTKQRFHLVTTPIKTVEGSKGVKRLLEKQTGATFSTFGESGAMAMERRRQ